jgi:hypothetical protein
VCAKNKEGSAKLKEENSSLPTSEVPCQESGEDCVGDSVASTPSYNLLYPRAINNQVFM